MSNAPLARASGRIELVEAAVACDLVREAAPRCPAGGIALPPTRRAATRQGRLARLDALRIEIRTLIAEVSHAADVELLDLMADEIGSFARHKAAQEARTWAATAGITLETGLMQLGRAIPAAEKTNETTVSNTMTKGGTHV
ncbi:hypothetical protein [Burkholderia gladioli]|uniref:hypothetical protein n=1 Tax=Burkholderia gladioli TaxID=28095 RepID=UPI001FC87DD5|nr:hypothetical protein [Burkholderia gladioli]